MLLATLAGLFGLALLIGILMALAERSLARQRGSKLKRGRDERHAAGRFMAKFGRWGGGGSPGV